MDNEDLSQIQNSAPPDSLLDSFALICRLQAKPILLMQLLPMVLVVQA